MKFLYNPPKVVKSIFPNTNWETKNKKILFTFDDGPIPETTEFILKELNIHKIKSIFFCVGDNIKKYNSLAEIILKENHQIGNHTFHHKIPAKLNKHEFEEELISFNNLMKEKFDYEVKYFRPPHGRIKINQISILKKLKLKNVMWSLLTYDYKNDLKIVKFAVSNYLNSDSIIVFHDSLKSKDIISDSIKITLDEIQKHGFEIGEPSGCLK